MSMVVLVRSHVAAPTSYEQSRASPSARNSFARDRGSTAGRQREAAGTRPGLLEPKTGSWSCCQQALSVARNRWILVRFNIYGQTSFVAEWACTVSCGSMICFSRLISCFSRRLKRGSREAVKRKRRRRSRSALSSSSRRSILCRAQRLHGMQDLRDEVPCLSEAANAISADHGASVPRANELDDLKRAESSRTGS